MKRNEIKKPNPEALDEASKLINDIVNKKPSSDFFNEIEKTNIDESDDYDLPRIASHLPNNSVQF